MAKKTFTDNDRFEAMVIAYNHNLNMDDLCVEAIKEAAEKSEPMAKWNGATTDYNGLDILNMKHPVFGK